MSTPFTAQEFNRWMKDSLGMQEEGVRTRDSERFRYIDVGTFACPDAVIVECLHRDTIPVESAVLGAPVAELCATCDKQLPLPWPEGTP
jgi:hypothetical protein